jgi:hypothetical protein
MGLALDFLRVRLAKAFVGRHQRVTAEGNIVDVESYWRQLPPSVRKTFRESMHAPTVQGGQSHPFDAPDARPLRDLAPGERAAYEAVQQRVGERKLATLEAKVGTDTRSAGYLKRGQDPWAAQMREATSSLNQSLAEENEQPLDHSPGKPGAPVKRPPMGVKTAKDAEGHDLVLGKDGIWRHK